MYRRLVKRLFDLLIACVFLLVSLPLLLILCLMVRIFLGSPILFKQQRPGLNEKLFTLYKFKTMRDIRDKNGNLLEDKDRLTKFGKILRSLSLDELPELINVLIGDMSLVGPRPLLMEYLPYYTEEQKLRHMVRPGITGWAQVNGRNHLTWKKKFECDIWYVKNYSFLIDVKIILITVVKIFKREGINAVGETTMSRFDLKCKNKGE